LCAEFEENGETNSRDSLLLYEYRQGALVKLPQGEKNWRGDTEQYKGGEGVYEKVHFFVGSLIWKRKKRLIQKKKRGNQDPS